MSNDLFVAGDLSGIQDYVLNVSTLGGGQARRLRARSFFVQVVEEVATRAVLDTFQARWDEAVLLRGGGQFLLRVPHDAQAQEKLHRVREELERHLYRETRGELGLTLAWASSLTEALRNKDRQKRRLWALTVTGNDCWRNEALSIESLTDKPCQICNRQAGGRTRRDGEEEIRMCGRCCDDTEIGRKLPVTDGVELCRSGGDFQVFGWGLRFNASTPATGAEPLHTPKLHVPANLTFEQIADKACGDNLLAVLKADVDSMGAKLGEIAQHDSEYRELKEFSHGLDDFFGGQVQEKLRRNSWHLIYTIYSGGDDLLLVGPWNVILDFAGEVHRDFSAGPGKQYGLTFSAGIALVNYRVPIRDAVERADALLEWAKGRHQPGSEGTDPTLSEPGAASAKSPKDRCAALGWVWKWERHAAILGQANKLKGWIDQDICPRSLAHRLLSLAQRKDPLRTAHWAYEVGRNFPKSGAASPEAREFRAWGERVLAEIIEDPKAVRELAVQLRYALTATRSRRDNP